MPVVVENGDLVGTQVHCKVQNADCKVGWGRICALVSIRRHERCDLSWLPDYRLIDNAASPLSLRHGMEWRRAQKRLRGVVGDNFVVSHPVNASMYRVQRRDRQSGTSWNFQ